MFHTKRQQIFRFFYLFFLVLFFLPLRLHTLNFLLLIQPESGTELLLLLLDDLTAKLFHTGLRRLAVDSSPSENLVTQTLAAIATMMIVSGFSLIFSSSRNCC